MECHQIVRPAIAALCRVVQIRNFVKVLPLMRQQGVIDTQDTVGLEAHRFDTIHHRKPRLVQLC